MSILKASQIECPEPIVNKEQTGTSQSDPDLLPTQKVRSKVAEGSHQTFDRDHKSVATHRSHIETSGSDQHSDVQKENLFWISLMKIEIEVIIGIHPQERVNPQPLSIDLQMGLEKDDWIKTAITGALSNSIDYAQIAQQIKELADFGRFRLLESLAYVAAYMIVRSPESCEERPPVQVVKITIRKPRALSAQETPIPVVISEVRSDDLVTSSLRPQIDLNRLHQRYGVTHATVLTPIVSLDEVSVIHVSVASPGSIDLRPQERIIKLGGMMTIEGDHAHWPKAISALHIIRHESTSDFE